MKLKTISRSYESAARDSRTEVRKVHKNADPKLHPFEKAREYTRAVTAAKLDRMFAAPFIGALSEHSDGVYCMATNPKSLVSFVSGSADGEVIVWDLASKRKLWSVIAHTGFVRGLTMAADGEHFYSCGDDKRIRQWRLASDDALAAALAAAASAGSAVGSKRPRSAMVGGSMGRGGAAADDDEDGGEASGAEEEEGDEYTAMVAGARSGGLGRATASAAAAGAGRGASLDVDLRPRYGAASLGRAGAGGGATSAAGAAVEPVATWSNPGGHSFLSIDHHWKEGWFATSGPGGLDVWDAQRSAPTHSFSWGADSVTCLRWNPAEHGLLASTGADRSVCLYDVRTDSVLRKTVMAMSGNSLAWNPREPFNFTVASEDSNCYTFDMRRMDSAMMVHKDHVGAVMDIAYAPTGREFVTGSYDRTIRLWAFDGGKSREIYHTKRMQRVFAVRYSGDAKYVLSGSDDTNVRIWKSNASAQLGRALPRERAKTDYHAALLKRFGHMPEVKKIAASRHVPKLVVKLKGARFEDEQRSRRKLANVRAHTAADSKEGVPDPERKRHIVGEIK
jgi:WD40 repeat protein